MMKVSVSDILEVITWCQYVHECARRESLCQKNDPPLCRVDFYTIVLGAFWARTVTLVSAVVVFT